MTTIGNSFVAGPAVSTGFVVSANTATENKTDETTNAKPFADRRSESASVPSATERRQFGNSHQGLSDDGRELALAIDRYKLENHRRYLTCDEMLQVLGDLGYTKSH
ncbi:hypothetical protein LF1_31300 [Rubripirellula obstinata]|uniref:Uncharacterized protein n=1 Tax=Rubripirellula obstinata TaxID=406547 RepID=A0A5B1CM22_9BACT|nr:hypothetical protein [Rubripirellula obstinata]KAA1260590.1 hypothetical protein LF1_31300 [Rubripirellula obstinata]